MKYTPTYRITGLTAEEHGRLKAFLCHLELVKNQPVDYIYKQNEKQAGKPYFYDLCKWLTGSPSFAHTDQWEIKPKDSMLIRICLGYNHCFKKEIGFSFLAILRMKFRKTGKSND